MCEKKKYLYLQRLNTGRILIQVINGWSQLEHLFSAQCIINLTDCAHLLAGFEERLQMASISLPQFSSQTDHKCFFPFTQFQENVAIT